ncbi:DUF445 family protein [Oceanirhabdus sp. W0125-5]|uniref:DUF445 family protein n=1 Tax=Oceanirhabdus sp. W0125-5 TaxID=2999116 RepID=UPI0022F2BED2|nr:DUF445 family protein [Oceanirhabdus sp. W0125-5]WBW98289.1 DUF445 family protein [Oceanirhabdus sp. W0125-5]
MKIILTGLVGALIGYVTNWLAIKMLFRPHNEMRIKGIKIPFTPGLIPKEKARIAKSVGKGIGDHLLTEDTIQEHLCGEKVDNAIRTWINMKIKELIEKKETLKTLLEKGLGGRYKSLKQYVVNLSVKYSKNLLNNEETKTKVIKIIKDEIEKLISVNVEDIIKHDLSIKFQEYALKKIKGIKESDDIKVTISNTMISFINDDINNLKKLNEIIPESTQVTIYSLVENNREEICNKLINALEKDSVKEEIISSINDMVNTKLSPMIAMFVKGESIYPLIISTLESYLEQDENRMMIVGLINNEIKNLLDNTVGNIVDKYGQDKIKSIIHEGSSILLNNFINNETIDNLFNKFINSFDKDITLKEFIEKIDEEAIEKLDVYINKIFESIIRIVEDNNYIEKSAIKTMELIEGVYIGEILEKNSGMAETIESEAVALYKGFMENNSGKIAQMIDIPEVVEEKINEFEMAEMEEIILEIASKELKAITWFGALLGFAMGVISQVVGRL